MFAGHVIVHGTPQVAVVMFSDQLLSVPPSPSNWSALVRVHVPLGFSPVNAPKPSTGASNDTVVPVT